MRSIIHFGWLVRFGSFHADTFVFVFTAKSTSIRECELRLLLCERLALAVAVAAAAQCTLSAQVLACASVYFVDSLDWERVAIQSDATYQITDKHHATASKYTMPNQYEYVARESLLTVCVVVVVSFLLNLIE